MIYLFIHIICDYSEMCCVIVIFKFSCMTWSICVENDSIVISNFRSATTIWFYTIRGNVLFVFTRYDIKEKGPRSNGQRVPPWPYANLHGLESRKRKTYKAHVHVYLYRSNDKHRLINIYTLCVMCICCVRVHKIFKVWRIAQKHVP